MVIAAGPINEMRSMITGCAMLLDLLGPAGRCSAPKRNIAKTKLATAPTMELGRSERTTMRPLLRPLWSYGVDGANTPDRKPR
jgi:hypothetical protein